MRVRIETTTDNKPLLDIDFVGLKTPEHVEQWIVMIQAAAEKLWPDNTFSWQKPVRKPKEIKK